MMHDSRSTFDSLIARIAPDPTARDRILQNHVYRHMADTFAGSQDYMATEKLHDLVTGDRYDLVVLDTPPVKNALDFLEAPGRLTRFVEGRALRFLLRPGMRAGRLGFSMVERVAGVSFLRDLSDLAAGFEGMYDGFARRAADVSELLASERTTFLLITVPQVEPLAEADFFWRALRERELPFGGMIVNKVHPSYVGGVPAARTRLKAKAKRALREAGVPDPTAGRAAENLVHYQALADRDRENIEALERRIGSGPIVEVPLLDHDVHDLKGVALVARHLFAEAAAER
jgi:anion-transporting  ArsA/GET3 family ATPase